MATILSTIPVSRVSPGPPVSVQGQMPASVQSKWQIVMSGGALWPANGDVIKLEVDESPDNGATWFFSASITLAGGSWPPAQGGVSIGTFQASPLFQNGLIRLTGQVLQACDIGAVVQAV